jgi:Zn-dependent protease with chaperone function
MAVDFFQRQDNARRQTVRLLVLFGLSVIAIIIVIYALLAIGVVSNEQQRHEPTAAAPSLWQPQLLVGVTLGTLLVIGMGSLYKIAELSAGGEHIAQMLGGRPINPQTTDIAERRLLNVVEEMALASGIVVPQVYVLDQESGINAFAAGHQPSDAVVAVSSGCLRYLSREELQGVMGHEFSHILNGDMRLNLRLIGIVYGILVLAVIGYYTMRSAGAVSSGSSKKSDGAAGVFFFGLALLIIGYIGVFFGNLIKSAISRQREYLADASSVQFTRNPSGIAGALKKIGGLTEGSRIRDGHANEISHMFFGDAFAGSFLNLFATHPPLAERIKALEPEFDGLFPEVRVPAVVTEAAKTPAKTRRAGPIPVLNPATILAGASGLDSGNMVRQIGQPQQENLSQAARVVEEMPQALLDAAREPFLAQAVNYVLLLSREDEAVRNRQWQILETEIEPPLYQQARLLADAAQSLPAESRLPLVNLTVPSMKMASPQQYQKFRQVVDALAGADQQIDLFEYCLRTILFRSLDVHFGLTKPPAIRYRTINAITQPATLVLSMLAYIGHKNSETAERAYRDGAQALSSSSLPIPLEQCNLKNFDMALSELDQATPAVKRRIIQAVTACIVADGKITIEESELLRAVAAALDCPMPLSNQS